MGVALLDKIEQKEFKKLFTTLQKADEQESVIRDFITPHFDAVISSPHEVRRISSALRAVSHHAPACIYLRLDDIHGYGTMICNPCGIDDIHACGVIFIEL